jgi:hypothetical protein
MKTYTLSGGASFTHVPEHPERTGRRNAGHGLNFDVIYKVWPSRAALARTIRMQQKRETRPLDWRACVKLSDGEGY